MKQSRLDSFFNITYKNKTNLNKTPFKNIKTNIFNTKTPNNTPVFNSIQNNTKVNPFVLNNKLNNNISSNNISSNNISRNIPENNPKYILRFDGASKGNPGNAGAGAVLYKNDKEIWNISRHLGHQTNNYAECFAAILGIEEAAKRNIKTLYVEGDSMLIINQLKGKWQVKNNDLKTLYLSITQSLKSFEKITFKHIYRNNNSRADQLANEGILYKKY